MSKFQVGDLVEIIDVEGAFEGEENLDNRRILYGSEYIIEETKGVFIKLCSVKDAWFHQDRFEKV